MRAGDAKLKVSLYMLRVDNALLRLRPDRRHFAACIKDIILRLVLRNPALRVKVMLQRMIPVQMILKEIEEYGDMRVRLQPLALVTGKLEDRDAVGVHLINVVKTRLSDIPHQEHRSVRARGKHRVEQRAGRALAFGSCNSYGLRAVFFHEDFRLGSEFCVCPVRRVFLEWDAGADENIVVVFLMHAFARSLVRIEDCRGALAPKQLFC